MKLNKWSLFAPMCLILTSCSEKNDSSSVVSQQFVHKYGFDMDKSEWNSRDKEGKSITLLENGVTITKSYNEGVLHGPSTYTFANSSIIEKVELYDEGTLVKQIFMDEAGIPFKEESFEPGNKTAITHWDKFGVPISIESYESNALVMAKYYKPNNELEASIQDGSGVRIKRDRNGELQYKDILDKGVLKERTTFHSNGQIQSKMCFHDYKLHGEQITYSDTASIIMRTNWSNGNLDGEKIAYRNGNKISEIPYVNGKKHGIERHWKEDGSLLSEVHWDSNTKHGSQRVYNDDETLISWFYKGKQVSINKFEEFSQREKLIADRDAFYKMVQNLDDIEVLRE